MDEIRLFDLMDVRDATAPPPPDDEALVAEALEAAKLWPWTRIRSGGDVIVGDEFDPHLLPYLQKALVFRSVTPGSDGDRVGFSAEVHIAHDELGGIPRRPLALARLPGVQFWLQETKGVPARVYVTRAATGDFEIVLEGVPVDIRLPPDLVRPLRSEQELKQAPEDRPDVELAGPFVESEPDSFAVILRETESSSIFVRMRVRITEAWEVVLDPAVPLSFGPCVFSYVPCEAVYDLMLLPHVRLAGEEAEEAVHEQEIAIEWADSKLGGIEALPTFTARTLELANRGWVAKLLRRINEDREPEQHAELVIEDIAVGVPSSTDDLDSLVHLLPQHGRVGLRRRIHVGGAEPEAYDHSLAPLRIPLLVLYEMRIFRLLLQWPGAPWVFGDMALVEEGVLGGDEGTTPAVHVHVGDDLLVQLGYELANFGSRLFKFKKLDIRLIAFRVGVDVPALSESLSADAFQLLADLAVVLDEDEDEEDEDEDEDEDEEQEEIPLTLASRDGERVEAVLRNIGWDRGGASLEIWIPDKVRAKALDRFNLDLDEIGALSEPNGARYLFVSGTIPLAGLGLERAGEETDPSPKPPAGVGSGIRIKRLRVQWPPKVEGTAWWGVDGITLSIRTKGFEIFGQGSVTSFARGDGHHHREYSFGAGIKFKRFEVGATFVKGSVKGPVDNFDYFLGAGHVGGLPSVILPLEDVHGLYARKLVPALPPPDGNSQTMRLYNWYKSAGGGRGDLAMPESRSLAKWTPRDESTAWGVGAGLSGWGKALTADVGVFFVHTDEGVSFVIGADLYALESTTPFAFAAVERDEEQDKISVFVGLDVRLSTIFGRRPIPGAGVRVSGQLFWTNRPSTVAVGFIDDVNTWLSVRFDFGFAELFVGGCYHTVDSPDGPKAWAFIVRFRGGFDAGRLGRAVFYLELGARVGSWRNQAEATGTIAWLEGAIKIELFGFFRVGIFGRVEVSTLGPEPDYNRYTVELRIDTPWWLPDVTFRKVLKNGSPQSASQPIITMPVAGGAALAIGTLKTLPVLVPSDADESAPVVSLDAVRGLPAAVASDSEIAALAPVSCDSVIAVDFAAAVDDETTIGENTPAGAGVQQSGDLRTRYALVGLSIRRRPHYGPAAGTWTELLAPEQTQLDLDAPDISVVFHSAVSTRWNRDYVAEDRLDPRQLLVNADLPYTFVTDGAGDDVRVTSEPGSLCCRDKGRRFTAPWHSLDFDEYELGVRTSSLLAFESSGATLRWGAGRPPVVAPGIALPSWTHVARLPLAGRSDGALLTLVADTPLFVVDLAIGWNATMTSASLVFEAFDGLTLRKRVTHALSTSEPSASVQLEHEDGFDSVVVRLSGDVGVASPVIELARARYKTIEDLVGEALRQRRCLAGAERALGGGRFTWLPHHDYEITAQCSITLEHLPSGTQQADVAQRVYFRTKGLPGLNAPERPNEELEPYLDQIYPRHGRLLYRREPVVCAFNERFNVLAPVEPVPSHPVPENTQPPHEWTLAVDRDSARAGESRMSGVGEDWIVAHRVETLPPPPWLVASSETAVTRDVRTAPTRDPLRLRYEAVLRSPQGCDRDEPFLHQSHVLLHEPVEPESDGSAPLRWEPSQSYRARLSVRNGPFVERLAFDPADATGLSYDAEAGAAESWTVAEGEIAPPASASGRSWALFGDATWRNAVAHLDVAPAGGQVGLAIAVSGSGATLRGVLVVVDATGADPQLRVIRLSEGIPTELAAEPISGQVDRRHLEVGVYEDVLRARVGTTSLVVPRGEMRMGRFALVSTVGSIASLVVEPLEGFGFTWTSSRYDDFEHHVGSFRGPLGEYAVGAVGGASMTVPGLLAETLPDLRQVMRAQADPEARQRLFDHWTEALGIPERPRPGRLEITRIASAGGVELLLLESPEPLPFSEDVSIEVWRRIIRLPEIPDLGDVEAISDAASGGTNVVMDPPLRILEPVGGSGDRTVGDVGVLDIADVAVLPDSSDGLFTYEPRHTRVLSNGDETRALVIPSDVSTGAWSILPRGPYRLDLYLNRARYVAADSDPLARLKQNVSLRVWL